MQLVKNKRRQSIKIMNITGAGSKPMATSNRRQAPKLQAIPSGKLDKKVYNDIQEVKGERIMKTNEALKIIGGSLSKPSKMPGWSIGLPAKECKTGGKLQKVPGSVCYDCYAIKGCYVFKVVQDAQYRRLAAIKEPAMG